MITVSLTVNGITDGVLVRMDVQLIRLVDACRMYCGPTLPLIWRVNFPAARDTGVSVTGGAPLTLKTLTAKVVPE